MLSPENSNSFPGRLKWGPWGNDCGGKDCGWKNAMSWLSILWINSSEIIILILACICQLLYSFTNVSHRLDNKHIKVKEKCLGVK